MFGFARFLIGRRPARLLGKLGSHGLLHVGRLVELQQEGLQDDYGKHYRSHS